MNHSSGDLQFLTDRFILKQHKMAFLLSIQYLFFYCKNLIFDAYFLQVVDMVCNIHLTLNIILIV